MRRKEMGMISVELNYANVIAETSYDGNSMCISIEDEDGGVLWMHYTLREFLDALNITAADCQKAFEEGADTNDN